LFGFGGGLHVHEAEFEKDTVNTACFAHKRGLNARWDVDISGKANTGKGENRRFLTQLMLYTNYKKIGGAQYTILNYSLSSTKQNA